ncbi:protein Mpv17 isoform X3 [Scyliorhinus canicula]|uniref:protein Mpv17 isoform X3 n=1 Tax=Scyliorhinus canicula TaxID=7830 RepID=UPI0018F4FB36|nr:protein Mpv17 isoform X3 [Scyliorhinus canicula]
MKRNGEGTLVGCSDVVSQQLIERRGFANHDTKRTIRMTVVGLIYVGPVLGVWYNVLDKIIVGHSKTVAFKKMLLDQFALAPCFLACFLAVASFLGGHTPEEVWLKLKTVAPDSDCCTDVEYLPLMDGKQMRFYLSNYCVSFPGQKTGGFAELLNMVFLFTKMLTL